MFAFKSSLLLESQPLTGIALRSPVTPDPFSCSRSVKRLFTPDFPSLLLYYFTMGASFSAFYWLESVSSSFARENPQLELPEPTVSNIISERR
ncbi:hypothetical protein FRC02_010291 [Tulasnella sp. 418]|nr:hypothetical protein FRC02_010291 [Tulasnella sp. 418]